MKEAWVCLKFWSKEMVTTALEQGADTLVLPEGYREQVKSLGLMGTVAVDGDLKPGVDVFFHKLESSEDEAAIGRLPQQGIVVLDDPPEKMEASEAFEAPRHRSWEIIPLENLVARGRKIYVPVYSVDDVKLAVTILEKGVSGVVIHADSPRELKRMLQAVKSMQEKISLVTAVIERIDPAGLGDRVCVDTCTMMQEGQGMLVGNSSAFLYLVQAEARANPYVAPRPFRVNAGPVHAYVRVSGGGTRYLSELAAGDTALVVRASDGSGEEATIGRVKIERRPLLLVWAEAEGLRGSILLQNAETIRLTTPQGEARSVVQLKPGDEVLVAVEKAGRHFGMKVDETIWEK